jgi:hypothetical protein
MQNQIDIEDHMTSAADGTRLVANEAVSPSSPAESRVSPRGKWQRLMGSILTAVLLLPVPASAAINWISNWEISTGSTTQNVNTTLNMGYGAVPTAPDSLFILPTAQSNTTTTITLDRKFLAAPNQPITATAFIGNIFLGSGGNSNVQLAVWTTNGGSGEGDIIGSSGSPLTLNGNNQLLSNQFGRGPILGNGANTLHVEFFINSTNWSISPLSPSQVIFAFTD